MKYVVNHPDNGDIKVLKRKWPAPGEMPEQWVFGSQEEADAYIAFWFENITILTADDTLPTFDTQKEAETFMAALLKSPRVLRTATETV